MRVIQINCVYRNGSTGKIVNDLHMEYTAREIDSYVIYGRGQRITDEKNVYKCSTETASKVRNGISRLNGNLYGMGFLGTQKIVKLIENIAPDIVHLHCINGYFCDVYALLKYLKEKGVSTVLTLHAEFMYTGNCGYAFDCNQWMTGCQMCENPKTMIGSNNKKASQRNWLKMHNAFLGFDNLVAVGVSDWISDRARQSTILKDKKTVTVLNGLNDSVFFYRNLSASMEKLPQSCQGKKILLYVTPYFEDDNKGGHWILKLADILPKEKCQIVVVGNKERKYDVPNITFLGRVESQDKLAELYSLADICLLTSKRETFSMVTAESLCCGTPVVGFEAGAPERIALAEYSDFVPYGDEGALAEAVTTWMKKSIDKKKLSQVARNKYSSKKMADNYLEIYQNLSRKE